MAPGRNDPCFCGSSKKYKHCCMDNISKQHASIFDDIAQTVAMSPELSLDELNLVVQHKNTERNNKANADFAGLSPAQMHNWIYAPFSELEGVIINTPVDLSTSPVMCYLALIIDEAMQQGGSFKTTSKGNLPAKLVKQATELLPKFAVAEYSTPVSINEFAGSNEDKFNALHYTRILAIAAGIIYNKSGRLHIKKTAQKQYQTHGLKAFYLPMFEAATTKYNWAYFDSFPDDIDLRDFWVFMLWRVQSHGSIERLIEEVATAFPDLLLQLTPNEYHDSKSLLGLLIESRFINRCLQFWGFISVDPKRFSNGKPIPIKAEMLPLLTKTFQFTI